MGERESEVGKDMNGTAEKRERVKYTREEFEAFVYEHYGEMSAEEIGKEFGLSKSTTQKKIGYMRRIAKPEVKEHITKKPHTIRSVRVEREIKIEYPDVPWHIRLTNRNQALGPVRDGWWKEDDDSYKSKLSEHDDQITEWFYAGVPQVAMARMLGVSDTTISVHLSRLGLFRDGMAM